MLTLALSILLFLSGVALVILSREHQKLQEQIKGFIKELDDFYENEQDLVHELHGLRCELESLEADLELEREARIEKQESMLKDLESAFDNLAYELTLESSC